MSNVITCERRTRVRVLAEFASGGLYVDGLPVERRLLHDGDPIVPNKSLPDPSLQESHTPSWA